MTTSAYLAVLLLLLPMQAGGRSRRAAPAPLLPYEVVPLDAILGHLMEGRFKEPTGVCFDATARELYVADMKNALIGIFNEPGVPVFAFGGKLLNNPKSVLARADGSIFVLDAEPDALKAFNYRGEQRASLRFEIDGEALSIGAVTTDPAGRWYVADARAPRVAVFDADLKHVLSIPRADGVGEFELVSALAVSPDGLLAVIDHKATPVQLFDASGHFVAGFGGHDIGLADFSAPVAAAFDQAGFGFDRL